MRNYLTKEGDELVGREISEIAVKNDGDAWVAKHRSSNYTEVVELEWFMEDWGVFQIGVEGFTPAENFTFLFQVKLPELAEN